MSFMFDKGVDEYLANCTPKFNKEDLIRVLEEEYIPGTDANIRLFMEINSDMRNFREAMTAEWFERMGSIARKNFTTYDRDEFPGTWKMDDIIFKVVHYGFGEANKFNIWVNDDLFRSGITAREVLNYKDAMSYGRTVKRIP